MCRVLCFLLFLLSACSLDSAQLVGQESNENVAESERLSDLGDPRLARSISPSRSLRLSAENLAAAELFLGDNKLRSNVKETPSGLQYIVITDAEGEFNPSESDWVEIDYVGRRLDGTVFDPGTETSTEKRGPIRFLLNSVVKGMTEGLTLMTTGDEFHFFLHPSLAYGDQGTPDGAIGPNEALIFEVKLRRVINPERNLAASKAFLAENRNRPDVIQTESGLQFEILERGPAGGKSPTESDVVLVNYRGTLIDGVEFDSSYARGEAVQFPIANVIRGWTEGVQLMSVGDKFRFYIPPELAYGAIGTPGGPIAPNDLLIFDVELLSVI